MRGKYVEAIADLPQGTVLFEETALLCWALHHDITGEYVARSPQGESYCDCCLSPAMNKDFDVDGVAYCSERCQHMSIVTRRILPESVLTSLRRFHTETASVGDDDHGQNDKNVEDAKNNNSSEQKRDEDVDGTTTKTANTAVARRTHPYPISVEALGRCVASVTSRFVRAVEAYAQAGVDLYHDVIEPCATSKDGALSPVLREIFASATDQVNRFVEPPPDVPFEGINEHAWYSCVRNALKENVSETIAAAFSEAALNVHNVDETDKADQQKNTAAQESVATVTTEIVTALLSDATLRTFLGQLSVNTQALNIGIGCLQNAADKASQQQPLLTRGAGIFTLQSCFNHSCDPNVTVQFHRDDDGLERDVPTDQHGPLRGGPSNEIVLKTTRDVKKGEELCITYIPEIYLIYDDYLKRRMKLESYFFTCMCHKCRAEEAAAKSKS